MFRAGVTMLGSRGIILKMATAMLAEVLDNSQYSTRLTRKFYIERLPRKLKIKIPL
jgi:hypothetical protein